MTTSIDFSLRKKDELIEVFPYGVTVGVDYARPVMIFKDKAEKRILPVWLSPIDAGIAVSQNSGQSPSNSPHNLTWKILDSLGVTLEKCCFKKVNGHHQFVDLYFGGNDKLKVLESRADEAMSFCLSTKTKFFCTIGFLEECRELDVELSEFEEVFFQNEDLAKRDQTYLN